MTFSYYYRTRFAIESLHLMSELDKKRIEPSPHAVLFPNLYRKMKKLKDERIEL